MKIWEFFKHAVGGGALTCYGASKVEDYVRQENVPEADRPKVVGVGIGVVGGGVIGYFIGEEIADHKRNYSLQEKAVSAAIGSAGGGIAGYVIGSYLSSQMKKNGAGKESGGA